MCFAKGAEITGSFRVAADQEIIFGGFGVGSQTAAHATAISARESGIAAAGCRVRPTLRFCANPGGACSARFAICLTLAIAACAPLPEASDKKAPDVPVVFPSPPDPPRFFYERTLYGSISVRPEDANRALRQLLTGEGEKGGEGLAKPYAVAVYQGRVFVTDSVQRFVNVFDIPGRRFYRIGDGGPGELSKPMGLDVDRSGNVYVADAAARAIVVFDKNGKYLRKIGGAKWITRLSSVTVDPKGDRMYVVDIGGVGSRDHRVRVFDPVNGRHLFDFGKRGPGNGEFNFPYDVAVGKEGRLYVVDAGNFRVQIFDRDGKYIKSFGKAGRQPGNFARPKEIATDPEGNVYVVDAAFGNFQIFDPEGELLMFIGRHTDKDTPAGYRLPSGISVDEDGRVYFVDQWYRKVDVFRPARLQPGQGYLSVRGKPVPEKK